MNRNLNCLSNFIMLTQSSSTTFFKITIDDIAVLNVCAKSRICAPNRTNVPKDLLTSEHTKNRLIHPTFSSGIVKKKLHNSIKAFHQAPPTEIFLSVTIGPVLALHINTFGEDFIKNLFSSLHHRWEIEASRWSQTHSNCRGTNTGKTYRRLFLSQLLHSIRYSCIK